MKTKHCMFSAWTIVLLFGVIGCERVVEFKGEGYYTAEDAVAADAINHRRSIADLLEYARTNPQSELADEALLLAADKHMLLYEYGEVIDILERVVEQYPDAAFAEVTFLPGLPSGESADSDVSQIGHYLRDHPDFSADVATCALATAYDWEEKLPEAIQLLEEYVAAHPSGRWIDEDDRFRRSHDPPLVFFRADEIIRYNLSRLHVKNSDGLRAKEVLEAALEIYPPSSPAVAHYLGRLATFCGEIRERRTLLQLSALWKQSKQGLPDMPNLPWPHLRLNESNSWQVRSLEDVEKRLTASYLRIFTENSGSSRYW